MGFKRLDAEDFLVSADAVSQTVWSDRTVDLDSYHTSSAQRVSSVSGEYYLAVYQTASTSDQAEVQFDIAFGASGSGGGVYFNDAVSTASPTSTVYGQYRSLILEDENSAFTFGTADEINNIYVIAVERARYKEKLLPASFNLTLQSSGGTNLFLTDNSKDVEVATFFGAQRAYQIVRTTNATTYGTAGTGAFNNGYTRSKGSYGLFLPDTGLIILNGDALDFTTGTPDATEQDYGINLGTDVTANTNAYNPSKLFDAIRRGGSFKLNCEETLTSDFVFVRARNAEFNYSENPSFIKGSTGEVYHDLYINAPQTYVTTVGLYNDQNDLLAVAKLSKPLLKDFTKEALIRVKLDF